MKCNYVYFDPYELIVCIKQRNLIVLYKKNKNGIRIMPLFDRKKTCKYVLRHIFIAFKYTE